jgi:molecular chaperone DnaK
MHFCLNIRRDFDMSRTIIDFGIELGVRNSRIAVFNGTNSELILNCEGNGYEHTPSAIWIDKRNSLIVGRTAKAKCEEDPENAFSEFMLQMGAHTEYHFVRSGRRVKPEEASRINSRN